MNVKIKRKISEMRRFDSETIFVVAGLSYTGFVFVGTCTGMLLGMKHCHNKNIKLDEKFAIVLGGSVIGLCGGAIPPIGLFLLYEHIYTKD
jgi:hypothetical protein